MKFYIKAKPNAKETKVEKIGEGEFRIWVKEAPRNGEANEAICRALADYFGVSAFLVQIVSGHHSRQKIVEVANKK